ncbi:hypothetical protein INH39_08785 [Massilia violaceinigra]|uniref:Teneurin NHL domain-containing protein n=1 Tax=Massilia violaceinigra TaxID=2045208 RepID=A0ABY4AAD1_9BURK|nr:hypothetical protein [Massilia violaceinigra]UOD31760.1 hypothetical protein INH39_08785 [Massilia violaceinigra]
MPTASGERRSILLSLAVVAAGVAAALHHFPRQQAYAAEAQQRERMAQAGRLQVIEHGVAMIDGLAVDARGRLFVSDQRENSVHAIDGAGKRTQFAGQTMVGGYPDPYSATSLLSPSGLGAGGDGNLYIADRGQLSGGCINFSRIRQIAPDGKVSAIAHADAAMDRASFPPDVTALAVGRNGDLYVQDQMYTYKLSSTGKRSQLPVPAAPRQDAPAEEERNRGLAAHPDGGVVVANMRHGVYRILPDQRAVPLASRGADCALGASRASGNTRLARPCMINALAVDARGRIFLWEGGRILRIDTDGAVSTVFNPVDAGPLAPDPPSTQDAPGLMALGPRGEIYLAQAMTLYKVTPWSRLRPR